jgi:hypothetical protein
MKILLTAMTAACALGAAAPAAAQYVNANAGGAVGIDNRIAQLESRLQAGIQAGVVDRSEAMRLRQDLRDLRRTERMYSRNGLTQQERMDLQARIREVRTDLQMADGGRFDNDRRYGSQDYQGQRYDRNGNLSVNGLYDRNGNRIDDNGYYGQGGPYEEADDNYACQDRGGIGGVIDTVTGRGCANLRVGARVSSNLGSVPYEYRGQYRDGNGYYYRSDGRNIYQIDARTNTVLRIYGMNR